MSASSRGRYRRWVRSNSSQIVRAVIFREMSITPYSPLADPGSPRGHTSPLNIAGILRTWLEKFHQIIIGSTADKLATDQKRQSRISAACHLPNNSNKQSVNLSS